MYWGYGDWSSKRIKEMIILFKFEKLPPEKRLKVNKNFTGLTQYFLIKRD